MRHVAMQEGTCMGTQYKINVEMALNTQQSLICKEARDQVNYCSYSSDPQDSMKLPHVGGGGEGEGGVGLAFGCAPAAHTN